MVTKIDKETGLVYQVTRPVEKTTFQVDCTKQLASGDTPSNIISVAVSPAGLVVQAAPLVGGATSIDGAEIKVKLSGGTAGEEYKITIDFDTSFGDVRSVAFMVKVDEAG